MPARRGCSSGVGEHSRSGRATSSISSSGALPGYGRRSGPALSLLLLLSCAAPLLLRPAAAQPAPAPAAAAAADAAAAQRAAERLASLNALPPAAGSSAGAALPPDGEPTLITIEEQLQQADALGVQLTPLQLARANPLLGPGGKLKEPELDRPADWPDGYFAVCSVIKNQNGADLREWIEYHRYIGTRKIYIYDNNSTEPLADHIRDYLHSGLVEYTYFVGRHRYRDLFRTTSQWWAYNDCATRFATRHRWLAFIDGDEFIMLRNESRTDNIEEFLTDYDQYGGLAVNWMIFGSSGHLVRPHGGVLVNYRACLPSDQVENTHVKIIANTRHLLTAGDDPHSVFYRTRDKHTVNEMGARVKGPKTEAPSHRKIALYHYLTKSRGEFEAKVRRGSAAGNFKNMGFFQAIEDLANATCTDAIPLGLRCCPSVHQDMARAAEHAQAAAAGVRPGGGRAGAGAAALPPGAPDVPGGLPAPAPAAAAASDLR
ncbi:hypothetical protein Rsub_12844 [Raphidocelis subcapitata]|uniref:Glycosyltransferase family 92 protein n=1 Tax=Raphidocelis subcapitata TaxID=307507 RepID=A0A2V0PM01_9CHLO|nr:hypothetical protein Rsub_12844 [Raphidocelis subcapitata]|eukprot:GBG00103.1 hypothetical protein Rsub_12844 [Raphidocelis subcapitata]